MASILITGCTGLLTQDLLDTLAEEYQIIITVDEQLKECAGKDGNINVYCTNPMEEKFRQLFDAYNFHIVWYISGYADGGNGSFGEMQWLERVLCCLAGQGEWLFEAD